MKKIVLIFGTILLLGVIGFIYVYFSSDRNKIEDTPPPENPFSAASVKDSLQDPVVPISLPLLDGREVQTGNFITNSITIEDPANAGVYYLAGTSGACTPEGVCPIAGNETEYSILYYAEEQSFGIGISTEPLGEVRKKAEQFLKQTLNISEKDMCALRYEVMTTTYVNKEYGGRNLGFSFCPGAVILP